MQLINFVIDRIIIHQVFRRDGDGSRVMPDQSHSYINFDAAAMQAFVTRVIDAIGDGSRAVEMEISNQEPSDLPSLIDSMIDQNDEDFAVSSYDIALKLADSQTSRSIPGGILVVFSGTQGAPSRKFMGVIKADVYSAYEKSVDPLTGEISLKFVKEVLLTPSSKLYKTAVFFENQERNIAVADLRAKWTPMVSDYQINQRDGKAAAKYFYAGFLGCGYLESSARTTSQFYESAAKFISNLDASVFEISDLQSALVSYLKVDTSPTISTSIFAERYLQDVDAVDEFSTYMRDSGVPNQPFTKDIAYIDSKLKTRRLNFRNKIYISAPSSAFDKIEIETILGEADENGNQEEWTRILIKDKVVSTE